MKTTLYIAALAATALFACGDDKKKPDAPVSIDAPPVDATPIPPAPHLGAQIDRMGRPAINTALNHVFDPSATTKGMNKDAYNADAAQATWPQTYTPEFAHNLAILDAVDKGLFTMCGSTGTSATCTSGLTAGSTTFHCSTTTTTSCTKDMDCPTNEHCLGNACGNQALYNNMAGGQIGSPVACFNGSMQYQAGCSYGPLAGILADDELYLDTSKTMCRAYLAVEFAAVTTGPGTNTDCGGRAPTNDVMDSTYSVAAAGIAGFDLTADPPAPLFGDTVGPHADITTTFPYFGPPH